MQPLSFLPTGLHSPLVELPAPALGLPAPAPLLLAPAVSASVAVLIVQFVTKSPTPATPTKSFHIERLLFISSILLGSGSPHQRYRPHKHLERNPRSSTLIRK